MRLSHSWRNADFRLGTVMHTAYKWTMPALCEHLQLTVHVYKDKEAQQLIHNVCIKPEIKHGIGHTGRR